MRQVLAVLALGAALFCAAPAAAGEGSIPAEALKALPENSNIVFKVRLAELIDSLTLQGFDLPGVLAQMGAELPFDLMLIEEVVLGGTPDEDPVVLVGFRAPIAEAALMQQLGARPDQPVGGRAVYQAGGTMLAVLPPRTLLVCDHDQQIQAALARVNAAGAPNALVQELAALPATAAFLVAGQDFELPNLEGRGPGAPARLERALVTLQAGAAISLEGQATLAAAGQADQLAGLILSLKGMARQQAGQLLAEPGQPPPAIAALEGLQVQPQGPTVSVAALIGPEDIALLPRLFERLPRLGLRSRVTANEASAISSMRVINTAEQQFRTTFGTNCYGSLSDMSGKANPPFIDSVLGAGTRSGYTFVLTLDPSAQSFECRAGPSEQFVTGNRFFYTNASAVIYSGPDVGVNANSPPID